MKSAIIAAILLILIGGYLAVQYFLSAPINTPSAISGTSELVLTEQDLQQIGMNGNGTDCRTEEYQTDEYSTLAQYSFCNYSISSLNDTEVIIELKKFANKEDLNGSYQYDSLHLYSVQGLISENDYGDMSRFRVNNENDYGGQFNDPNIYYYHLWITKDTYLIHITSAGAKKEAREYISNIGQNILAKFR